MLFCFFKKLLYFNADFCFDFPRFRFESNHLLDVSVEEEEDLPPVRSLIQVSGNEETAECRPCAKQVLHRHCAMVLSCCVVRLNAVTRNSRPTTRERSLPNSFQKVTSHT